jgi:hypothetical protein
VADDVAHEDIEHVIIDGNCFAKSWHIPFSHCSNGALSRCGSRRPGGAATARAKQLSALPINGQRLFHSERRGGRIDRAIKVASPLCASFWAGCRRTTTGGRGLPSDKSRRLGSSPRAVLPRANGVETGG